MHLVETLSHGVQTRTFDDAERTIHFEVRVDGRLAWHREAKSGTRQTQRHFLSTAQLQHALHLVAIIRKETEACTPMLNSAASLQTH
jgi:predicted Zn-dependent protease